MQKSWLLVPKPLIERGSPWENGYIESFNARLGDELLNGEIFYTLSARPKSSSKAGDATTTRSGPARRSDTSRRHQKYSSLPSQRGRLRSIDGSAGHAGATADLELTFNTDRSVGADNMAINSGSAVPIRPTRTRPQPTSRAADQTRAGELTKVDRSNLSLTRSQELAHAR